MVRKKKPTYDQIKKLVCLLIVKNTLQRLLKCLPFFSLRKGLNINQSVQKLGCTRKQIMKVIKENAMW